MGLFTEPLSEQEFDEYFNQIMERTRNVLKIKAAEYVRNEDRLHNFNKASLVSGVSRERTIYFMRLKHQVSIDDMVLDIDNGILPKRSVISEKFGDRLNYDILEEISMMHRTKNEKPLSF